MQTELSKKFPNNPEITVGIDGDHAFAMIGPDLQEGHAEFVPVVQRNNEPLVLAEYRARSIAIQLLRNVYGSSTPAVIPYRAKPLFQRIMDKILKGRELPFSPKKDRLNLGK